MFPQLTQDQQDQVAHRVKEFIGAQAGVSR
jgi:hypothetical protein